VTFTQCTPRFTIQTDLRVQAAFGGVGDEIKGLGSVDYTTFHLFRVDSLTLRLFCLLCEQKMVHGGDGAVNCTNTANAFDVGKTCGCGCGCGCGSAAAAYVMRTCVLDRLLWVCVYHPGHFGVIDPWYGIYSTKYVGVQSKSTRLLVLLCPSVRSIIITVEGARQRAIQSAKVPEAMGANPVE
jgi:hypothetical protein